MNSMPECYGSNPSPQDKAENCCGDCSHSTSCANNSKKNPTVVEISFGFTCPHCGDEHDHEEFTNEGLMRDFTEFYMTRIFRQEPFDKWFFEKFGEVENGDQIKYDILHSKGVEIIDGVVMLYNSPYLVTKEHRGSQTIEEFHYAREQHEQNN